MTPSERDKLVSIARREVAKAIRHGIIPKAKELKCADCGDAAEQYDHRDYRKPMKVDPLCKNCHYVRGRGLPACYRPIPNPTSAYSLRMDALIRN